MASKEVINTASTYLPKVAAVLLPAAYGAFRRMRGRPLLVVSRDAAKVVLFTTAKKPVEKLALRVITNPALTPERATCPSSEFTGYKLTQVPPNESRASFERFGRRDRLVLSSVKTLTVEVLDSEAIPIAGAPSRLLHALDAACVLAALALLTLHTMPIIAAYWADMSQQQSGTVNEVLLEFLRQLGMDLTLLLVILLLVMFAAPSRRRRAMSRRELHINFEDLPSAKSEPNLPKS